MLKLQRPKQSDVVSQTACWQLCFYLKSPLNIWYTLCPWTTVHIHWLFKRQHKHTHNFWLFVTSWRRKEFHFITWRTMEKKKSMAVWNFFYCFNYCSFCGQKNEAVSHRRLAQSKTVGSNVNWCITFRLLISQPVSTYLLSPRSTLESSDFTRSIWVLSLFSDCHGSSQ